MEGTPMGRCAAIVGSPVDHSRSPVLHRAAFEALGLADWSYQRIECDGEALPALVDSLGPRWVGLSVTMPCKRAALACARLRTERAEAVGSANTLLRQSDGGWRADCTDIDGVTGAIRAHGFTGPDSGRALLIGAGATASAAVAGLAELGIEHLELMVRTPERAAGTVSVARRFGMHTEVRGWDPELPGVDDVDIVVSAVPAGVVDDCVGAAARAPLVLDVVYHPWPTPMARAVWAAGSRLATGLDMLLHQAFGQVEQFTGRPAPRGPMAEALRAS
jgi:shikimate dehydrogenase